jgi:beta-mannosidase
MKTFLLNGEWDLELSGSSGISEHFRASVPGSVYSTLLDAGKMDDPFWRDNESKALAVIENDFVFFRAFDTPSELLAADRVILRFDGIDTIADIALNSVSLGHADNMHVVWEYDVKGLLRETGNALTVRIFSPTKFIRTEYEKNRADGASDAMRGFPLIRKAHCMFGWDWGPRLPDAGIWRGVTLLGIEGARIADVLIRQEHAQGRVILSLQTVLEQARQGNYRVAARVAAPDGHVYEAAGADCAIEIAEPALWWPNGLGAQPLYEAEIALFEGDHKIDAWTRRIGLRTLTVHRKKDEWGEGFCFAVNGREIFAMGADYIPEDNILARVNPRRTRALLEDAKAANHNCVRVWGGGYYPDDYFFDICDELGLIVWQDLMFACAVYNLTPEFEANIAREVEQNARRIRHHACLGLICGNNEMEQLIDEAGWLSSHRQKADYIKMYEYIFPKLLEKAAPDVFYWPASPSSGGSFDAPNDENRGDVHYWAVWHGLLPFTDYRNHLFRFVSEFGFQSFPCMKTIEAFTEPEDRNPFSYVMEKHQRNASANGKILFYLSQMYRYPSDMDSLAYASQLLQAQAIQYGSEHWRRNRGRCMGAVVWQLNDCWPVASWASIDYFGRWKALHYFEKRFFAPVLISCEENGVLSQDTNVNSEKPAPWAKTARLNVSNETLLHFSGTASWELRRADASVVSSGSAAVEVAPLSSLWLEPLDYSEADTYGCYFSYRLADGGGNSVGSGSALFCPPKHFRFLDPQLEARIEGDEVVVAAKAYARGVELSFDADVVLSDNYFDMDAGEKRVTVIKGAPKEVRARSVYDIGR